MRAKNLVLALAITRVVAVIDRTLMLSPACADFRRYFDSNPSTNRKLAVAAPSRNDFACRYSGES